MTIHALTVSVDYADHLSRSLHLWKQAECLIVVSSERDHATRDLCERHGVRCYLTDVFWRNGAKFNKGAAIAEAFGPLRPTDWTLFFDADIEPPADWKLQLESTPLDPANIYGARRQQPDGTVWRDPGICGWFMLAHASHAGMQVRPIVDTHFYHAGNYDSTFVNRWARRNRIWLPFKVTHHGEPGVNWCGVGNAADVAEIHRLRRGGRRWTDETIDTMPHHVVQEHTEVPNAEAGRP